jgi:guanine nucleotide-binding protein subunit alpha
MGNCTSTTDRQAKAHSDAIDREIESDSKKFRKECKILLLGSGESGKSTIVKQMKIIHQNGFSRDELLTYRMTIYRNLVDSAQAIVLAMRKIGLDCETPSNRPHCDRIIDYRIVSPSGSSPSSDPHAYSLSSNSKPPHHPTSFSSPSGSLTSKEKEKEKEKDKDKEREREREKDKEKEFVFDPEIALLIHQLWQDPVIPRVMDNHSSEFYLMDSAS